jgi:hypothetical protein
VRSSEDAARTAAWYIKIPAQQNSFPAQHQFFLNFRLQSLFSANTNKCNRMEVVRNYSDTELIHILKDNRQIDAGIKFLYKEYYGLLEYYVTNNKGSREDAADIIQETIVAFIEIIQQDKYRGDASVKSFLYSIARNIWLSELRKRKQH